MSKQTPNKLHNALWRLRRQRRLEQKQVAYLIGHKTTDLMSRYEQGTQQPGLLNTIKLSLLYQATLAEMFPEQAEQCRLELEANLKRMPRFIGQQKGVFEELTENVHLCTYEKLLEQPETSNADLDSIRRHVTSLMQKLTYR